MITSDFVLTAVKTDKYPNFWLQSRNSVQYSDMWLAFVKAVKNLRVP